MWENSSVVASLLLHVSVVVRYLLLCGTQVSVCTAILSGFLAILAAIVASREKPGK